MAAKILKEVQARALYIATAIVVGAQLLMLYWAFWPYCPLKVEYIKPIKIVNGQEFVYEMKYNKKMAVPCTIGKQFVDGITITLPLTYSHVETGEATSTHRVEIPKLPKGEYYFRWYAIYRVNPLREVVVSVQTAPFVIE